MGEETNLPLVLYEHGTGKWTAVEYIPSIVFDDSAIDGGFSGWNGVFTAEFKVRVPRSRKRFIKFLMANRVSRNEADRLARQVAAEGFSYSYAFAHLTLGF